MSLWSVTEQGWVVQKPVNVNPELKVNWSVIFSCLKIFPPLTCGAEFGITTAQNWKANNTKLSEHLTKKLQNWISKFSLTLC